MLIDVVVFVVVAGSIIKLKKWYYTETRAHTTLKIVTHIVLDKYYRGPVYIPINRNFRSNFSRL